MYNLIIKTKFAFSETICEQLVEYFGLLEVIPYSDYYCVATAIEIKEEAKFFRKVVIFSTEPPVIIEKLLVTDLNSDIEGKVNFLHSIGLNGIVSEIKAPQNSLGDNIKLKDNLWAIVPWEFEKYDC